MWETALIVLAGGAVLWNGLSSLLRSRQRLRAWQRASQDVAASCGLQVVESSRFWGLKARAGALEVLIGGSGDEQPSTQIVVIVPGPPAFYNVTIRPEPRTRFPWVREIEIGDRSFDSTFFVEGPIRLVCALLNAETRRLLIRVNTESRLEIATGALRVVMPDEKVPDILPLLLGIGQRLAQNMDGPRRLAENAKRDPEVGVRLQNLLVLTHELPGKPVTVEALRAACLDPSPELRLRAAKELGAEGRDVLWELAECEVDDAASAEAVSILDRELPFERMTAILDRALTGRRLQTARACVETLGRSGAAGAVDTLAKVLAQEQGELAAAAALALGTTGSPAAEPPLILALQREPADLRVAAVNALGHVGSAAAVLPLKEAAERSWLDRELRRATRQAIAEIQSRLQGASPGQLSLAGAEAGQLSLAQAEAGQLSLATDPGGQLSLPAGEAGQISLSAEEGLKPSPRGAA